MLFSFGAGDGNVCIECKFAVYVRATRILTVMFEVDEKGRWIGATTTILCAAYYIYYNTKSEERSKGKRANPRTQDKNTALWQAREGKNNRTLGISRALVTHHHQKEKMARTSFVLVVFSIARIPVLSE